MHVGVRGRLALLHAAQSDVVQRDFRRHAYLRVRQG
jgi:hypothetical protein